MLVEVRVHSLGMDRVANQPVVILQERGGSRVLPIWIGPNEANAIATQLAGLTPPRPLTHDLLVSALKGMGGTVSKVVIARVHENTYYAELIVRRATDVVTIDARPSDSIAVALRTDAHIFAEDTLLEDRTIEVLGAGDEEEEGEPAGPAGGSAGPRPSPMDADELQAYLRRLDPEDFGRFRP